MDAKREQKTIGIPLGFFHGMGKKGYYHSADTIFVGDSVEEVIDTVSSSCGNEGDSEIKIAIFSVPVYTVPLGH